MIVHVFLTWQGDKRKEEGKQKYIISLKKRGGGGDDTGQTDYRKGIFIYSGVLYPKGIRLSRSQESNQWKQKD